MKKKKLLALLLTATIVGGNVIPTLAAEPTSNNEISMTGTVEPKYVLYRLILSSNELSLSPGEEEKLEVQVDASGDTTGLVFTWSSSDESVVTVDQEGNLKAVGYGEAIIRVSADGKEDTCTVKVFDKIPIESITLNATELTLLLGESFDLETTIHPANATIENEKMIYWESTTPEVADVLDWGGMIKTKKPGKATIIGRYGRFTPSSKDIIVKCEVTVVATPEERPGYTELESIAIDRTSVVLKKGRYLDLNVVFSPTNATVTSPVSWTSSNKEVASISYNDIDTTNANLSALNVGTATITAMLGDKIATCEVQVIDKDIPAESISMDKAEVSLLKAQKSWLEVKVNPYNATEEIRNAVWKSSNPDVVQVNEMGMYGEIIGVGYGEAIITAEVEGKGVATCKVTVKGNEVALESIELDKKEVSLTEGETDKLTVSYNPSNTTVDKTVKWETSDAGVATVDKDGNIKAIKAGTATITAEVNGKKATCKITVVQNIPLIPSEPSTPVEPEKPNSGAVQTGDPSQIGLFGTMLAMSSAVLFKLNRKKDDEK